MGHTRFKTAFGIAAIVWEADAITAFRLPEDDHPDSDAKLAPSERSEASARVPEWVAQIAERACCHFRGDLQDFQDVPLAWSRVGEFQAAVYRHAQAILPGQTCSYGDIARKMGLPPASARAVGAALGRNPWPLLVPCHRVVSASGKMTGFSAPGGIRAKARLLALEGAELRLE